MTTEQVTALVFTNNDPANAIVISGSTLAANGGTASFSGGIPSGQNAKSAAQDATGRTAVENGTCVVSFTGGPVIDDRETILQMLDDIAQGNIVIP